MRKTKSAQCLVETDNYYHTIKFEVLFTLYRISFVCFVIILSIAAVFSKANNQKSLLIVSDSAVIDHLYFINANYNKRTCLSRGNYLHNFVTFAEL